MEIQAGNISGPVPDREIVQNNERIRVVLIDDNELTRAALRLLLGKDTVDIVAEAATGGGGLQACFRERPDLVMLDIMLPDADGLQLLAAIKDALPDADVIMVTACGDRNSLIRAMDGGADGFIIKPFQGGTVEEALRKARLRLQRKRSARPCI